ncbi:hypothetical protein KUTeg_018034, partial [Tegillarca granosa]
IFSKGIWQFNVKDAYLKELANKLPIASGQYHKTIYIYGFQKFKKWTDMFQETCALLAQPLHASLYHLGIMQSSNTCSPVNSAFYSISWAHKLAGYVDPILDVLPKSVKEAASRILGHGINRKQTRFQAGGATAAANNGVSDRLFKRHWRWKSEKAKDMYVKDDISGLLSVFASL